MAIKKLAVWQTNNYYQEAHNASKNSLNHPAIIKISKRAKLADKIIELGCGDGTKLSMLIPSTKHRTGVDVSKKAIELARKKYKDIKFLQLDIENKNSLPNETYDLVYSAFVLEHLESPEKFLSEAIRITKKDGIIILLAPNYGAPNRCSPCFIGSRAKKLIFGLYQDLLGSHFLNKNKLRWLKVNPRLKEKYQIDFDTTIEPYLLSMKYFLENRGVATQEFSSYWNQEEKGKLHQKIFKILSYLNLYPFKYWGPHMFYVGMKK